MKIIPAILAEDYNEFIFRLRQAESFTDYVQIDLMDGEFVPTRSFRVDKINNLKTSLTFEFHLMVKYPAAFISPINTPNLKKVLFHFESDVKHLDFIERMEKQHIKTGLAINPETPIDSFREIAESVDTILFLTVDPGHYGSPFISSVIKKIEKARRIFPDKIISADGGVSLNNLELFFNAGVDYVCVGSRIFLQDSAEENYRKFTKKIKELRNKSLLTQ